MKKTSKWIIWVLAALSPVLCLAVYPALPEQIPTNWGINGNVTYSGKATLLVMAALPLVLAALFLFLPRIDPRKKSYERFQKYYDMFCIFMMLFLLILNLVVISESFFPGKISVGIVVQLLLGVLFVFLGNMMPKFKSNFFIGIKNPWTLSNSDVWNKTHRLSGILFFWLGVLTILTCFWIPESISFWIFMSVLLIVCLVPSIMSYIWFRQISQETPDETKESEK